MSRGPCGIAVYADAFRLPDDVISAAKLIFYSMTYTGETESSITLLTLFPSQEIDSPISHISFNNSARAGVAIADRR